MADLRTALVVIALGLAAVFALYARHMVKRHGLGPLIWRWHSGMALDGYHRTDATWFRSSSVALHPLGKADPSRVHPWHHLPRIHRAAVRTGLTYAPLLVAYGIAVAPVVSLLALAVPVVGGGAFACWRVYRLTRSLRHHLAWHRPTYRALTRELPAPPTRLQIEPDRSQVTIGLPEDFTPSDRDREAIARVVTAKLALEAPEPRWELTGRKPYVVYTKSDPPPSRVPLRAVRSAVEAAAAHELVMGKGKRDQLVSVSLDNDSPHVGLSMGSGDGKSTVAKSIAAQVLYHGGVALILDYKLISHQWARGLPNVGYAGRIGEIHDALLWLLEEIGRRNDVALAGADVEGEVHTNVGPRLLVIAEELNATQGRLAAYWRREGGKGRSPASEALDEAQFIGRQVNVNVLVIGQRLSAKAAGSGDARENLGVRIMHDPSPATWKMLVGDRHALPPASGHLGRLQIVTAREVRETQGTYLTGKEARALALSGQIGLVRPDMPFVARVTGGTFPAIPGPDLRVVTPDGAPVTALPPAAVSLSEAVEADMFPSLVAARRASHRPGFPTPVGKRGTARLYDLGDLSVFLLKKEAV